MNKPKIPISFQQVISYLSKKIADQFQEFVKNIFDASDQWGKIHENIKIAHGGVKTGDRIIMIFMGEKDWGITLPGSLLMLPMQMIRSV